MRRRPIKLATLGALCLLLPAALRAQTIRQNFAAPAKAYRPMVRWWWPGGDVTDKELRREVDLLDQANFGGGEIQPFKIGLDPNMPAAEKARVDDYLTPAFFAHMKAALEEARGRGMWLDYTFGSGWPFGGAGITPELASVELRAARQTIRGPVHFHQAIQLLKPGPKLAALRLPPGWAGRLRAREKLVAVVAWRGSGVRYFPSQAAADPPIVQQSGELDPGTAVVLTARMQPDGTFDWDVPPGTWQVFAFAQMPTGQQVIGGAGSGPQLVLDHMNRQAFAAYASQVGGLAKKYDGEYFGHGLRAIFCDSLEVAADLYWSDDFLREFRERRGYDLTPYLPLLKVPGFGVPYDATAARLPLYDVPGVGDRVRRDYWQTVSDVMIANFYQPFTDWAARNDVLSRIQAHGSPTDLLRVYGAASIPETEDLLDQGRYDFLKMPSSAADLYGKRIVASESFVWKGKVYQTTPETIKRYADELLTAGINEIIYHGSPYERVEDSEGKAWPGWHPFATWGGAYSSFINSHNPFWPYLGPLNEYITRVQYISQTGVTVAPIALYREQLAYDAINPPPAEPEIDTRLMAAGYNFDHIDGYVLAQCHVAGGRLVSPGGAVFSALLLPDIRSVSAETARQLAVFARAGLPVLFIGRTPAVESASLTRPSSPLMVPQARVAPDAAAAIERLGEERVEPNLRFTGASVPFIEKRIARAGQQPLEAFFLRNPDDAPKQLDMTFHTRAAPQSWDPWTGKVEPIESFRKQGGTRIQLTLEAYGSKLLVFDPEEKSVQATPAAPTKLPVQLAIGQNGWQLEASGIGPASRPESFDLRLHMLVDWSSDPRLQTFSGRGEYTTAFTVPPGFFAPGRRLILDLGDVKDVAEIEINGRRGPTLLLRPYSADVTALVHTGENTLRITVVNALFNALSANGASSSYRPETTNTRDNRMPSGLIGPVRLEAWHRD